MTNFFDLSRAELLQAIQDLGQPRFRADQVWSWVYRQKVAGFEAMSNLPASLRRQLIASYDLNPAVLVDSRTDEETGTRKALLRLSDGESVEAVLMREPHGDTTCLSTQVGCPMACTICATGQAGFRRDLSAGEIVFQFVHFDRSLLAQDPPAMVTNVVFMGMGEPLLNYRATLAAIATLCDPYGPAFGAHRITVSTVGLPQQIRALAAEHYPVRLAVSLHGANDETRRQLVPLASRVNLGELLAACAEYARVRRDRVTFEYVLVKGVNDSRRDARQLVSLIGQLPSHVNLIPLNQVAGCGLEPSPPEAIQHFQEELRRSRIPCTVRHSRGVAIGAGCGQLRGGEHGPKLGS